MSETVIKCESVYKIFGQNAQKMLADSNGNVDAKTFQENGCIVGVNNASFEVAKGEMLVVGEERLWEGECYKGCFVVLF